jgi:AcrR family transcriptional regulator
MSSHKSSAKKQRPAQTPQRSNGILRFAAILEAASAVIAEKGYEAATMSEIAARSDTQIGSLYRFFPNKESLADTMVVNALENLDIVFDKFDDEIGNLSVPALADNLFSVLSSLNNRPAIMKLLDANQNWSVKREEFRHTAMRRIAESLMIYDSNLPKKTAGDIALVILLSMKTVSAHQDRFASAPGAMEEFRDMIRLYLKSRLTK